MSYQGGDMIDAGGPDDTSDCERAAIYASGRQLTGAQLVAYAREMYYRSNEIMLAVDDVQQVVVPAGTGFQGCEQFGVQIDADGWHEGWWSPQEPFRRLPTEGTS